ncbi:MAG: hypothetical protein FJ318_08345 [SAR202 cluster bacterium]|nr:hypothetical protein [SAR202 cluster bacterium]
MTFRLTVRRAKQSTGARPVLLHPRFRLRFMPRRHRGIRHAIFERVCIVTTPFFVGLPGFRSKWWLVDVVTGDYAGLYQWDTVEQARADASGLERVLRLVSVPGSVSCEVIADRGVDAFAVARWGRGG